MCPHCKNNSGFAFGTCCECGFNHLDNEFMFVEVRVSDLIGSDLKDYLIYLHAQRTKNRFAFLACTPTDTKPNTEEQENELHRTVASNS
jgi:hypothetical protein